MQRLYGSEDFGAVLALLSPQTLCDLDRQLQLVNEDAVRFTEVLLVIRAVR